MATRPFYSTRHEVCFCRVGLKFNQKAVGYFIAVIRLLNSWVHLARQAGTKNPVLDKTSDSSIAYSVYRISWYYESHQSIVPNFAFRTKRSKEMMIYRAVKRKIIACNYSKHQTKYSLGTDI